LHNRCYVAVDKSPMTSLNDLLQTLELGSLKGLLSSLLLPPVPLLLLVLVGARLLPRRRLLGWGVVLGATLGLWFSSTTLVGWALVDGLLQPPPALSSGAIADLKTAGADQKTAIVVLGAGREAFAPEYGVSNLSGLSIERLRYGVWLSRATNLPIGFTGGVAYGAPPGASEAEIAARIASAEFNRPLRWVESSARDTNENGQYSVKMMRDAGMRRVVVVTHGFHMQRALAAFERAARRENVQMSFVPAPMGLAERSGGWLPTSEGYFQTRMALREWLGRLAGA